MTIKEVEQELGVPRATIRFYEKQKLINPERHENTYRDYSDVDVAILKKILIFRKIGIPVAEIEDILDGAVPLTEVLHRHMVQLQEQIDELNGALKVCRQMQKRQEETTEFDEQFYWNVICQEEKAGNRFWDIATDTIEFEKKIIFKQYGIGNHDGKLIYGRREAFMRALGLSVFLGTIYWLIHDREPMEFLKGFCLPMIWIVIDSALGLPVHFLEKKYPEMATRIRNVGHIIGGLFVIALLILMLYFKIQNR